MKVFLSILFVLLPVVAAAQNYQGMSEADVQNMMQQMQQVQECMDKVDQTELEAIEQRSEEFEAEVKSLCEQGKRDEAQEKAVAWGKEMMDNPTLTQMRKCGEIAQGMVPPGQQQPEEYDFDFSKRHVCDE